MRRRHVASSSLGLRLCMCMCLCCLLRALPRLSHAAVDRAPALPRLDLNYAYVRAVIVDNICHSSVVPPPLNLLSIPARLLAWMIARTEAPPRDFHALADERSEEGPPRLQRLVSEEMIAEHLINRSSDADAGEERWRRLFLKKLTSSSDQTEKLQMQHDQMRAQLDEMHGLLRALQPLATPPILPSAAQSLGEGHCKM